MGKKQIIKVFILISILFIECVKAQEITTDAPVKLMTYNIRYLNNIDGENVWENRKSNVASLIDSHNADIVGLQESNLKQINDLQERLLTYSWYGVSNLKAKGHGDEHVAIFYKKNKFKLLDSGTFWLSENPNEVGSVGWDAMYPRIVSWVKLKNVKSKNTFFFFNTHFDHRGDTARVESTKVVLSKVKDIAKKEPFAVVGDFNFTDTSEAYKTLVKNDYLIDTYKITAAPHYGPVGTTSGFYVKKEPLKNRIDYIFVNNGSKALNHVHYTDNNAGKYHSDHLPVASEIILKTK